MKFNSIVRLAVSATALSSVAAAPSAQLRLQNSWPTAASSLSCANIATTAQESYNKVSLRLENAFESALEAFEGYANDWMMGDKAEFDDFVDESRSAADIINPSPPTKTVYEYIKLDPKFSKLAKLVDYDYEIVKILDGASHGLTFFAPDDDAIPHAPKNRSHSISSSYYNSLDLRSVDSAELFGFLLHDVETYKPDDDKKKEIFKKILHKVLLYHILPYDAPVSSLALNRTVPTSLSGFGGALDGQPLRIKVERGLLPIPYTKLNGHIYIKAHQADVLATNGVVHGVTRPLFPLPGIFQLTYGIPRFFSTFSTAIQHSGLESSIGYEWVHESEVSAQKFEGTPVVTVFVPNNVAFAKLPLRLQFFLFSRIGARALKKLLLFHVVPGYVIHTEWVYKESEDDLLWSAAQGDGGSAALRFPTALEGYKIPVTLTKTLPKLPIPGNPATFEITVLDQKVFNADLVAFNGAVHVLDTVLNPRRARKEPFQAEVSAEDDWADWEEWLPAWADEE